MDRRGFFKVFGGVASGTAIAGVMAVSGRREADLGIAATDIVPLDNEALTGMPILSLDDRGDYQTVRADSQGALLVRVTDDPNALPVRLT